VSLYYPVCRHKPCPVCGDTSGKCSINEYGYCLSCYGVFNPEVQEGDLRGFWKCFRVTGGESQWKDQRVALRAIFDFFVDETFKQGSDRIEKQGGES
jgi:hypothetical protein